MNNIEKCWVRSLYMIATTTITPPTTTVTGIAINYSEVAGNRNLTCLLMGFCTWHWVWFRDQRKEILHRDSPPGGVVENVSGTVYTGAGCFHIWPPGSLNSPKFAGRPFSLSAIAWDSAQMDYYSLCLMSVQSGAQMRGIQAAKVNISTPGSKNTGLGLRSLLF